MVSGGAGQIERGFAPNSESCGPPTGLWLLICFKRWGRESEHAVSGEPDGLKGALSPSFESCRT